VPATTKKFYLFWLGALLLLLSIVGAGVRAGATGIYSKKRLLPEIANTGVNFDCARRHPVRYLPRTSVARVFAACIVCLAASPVTAPFTTCDVSVFTHGRPADAPAPGHQVALPGFKAGPTENTVTVAIVVVFVAPALPVAFEPGHRRAFAEMRTALRPVLRI
jgi:hypothetical protein